MNKSQLVKKIYKELRISLGESFTAKETLDLANRMVAVSTNSGSRLKFSLRTGGISFDEQPIDKVFADGGWRVLDREWEEYSIKKQMDYNELWLSNRISRWKGELPE